MILLLLFFWQKLFLFAGFLWVFFFLQFCVKQIVTVISYKNETEFRRFRTIASDTFCKLSFRAKEKIKPACSPFNSKWHEGS